MKNKVFNRKEFENQFDLNVLQTQMLEQLAQVGDVLSFGRNQYALVINKDFGPCFTHLTFVECTFEGVIVKRYGDNTSAANYIRNSICMKNAAKIEIVNHIELRRYTYFHNCKKYSWYLTGDYAIDCYMALLDDRQDIFNDLSSEFEAKQYDKAQDCNSHSENGMRLARFAAKVLIEKLMRIGSAK